MTEYTRETLQEKFLDIALMDTSSPVDGAVFFSGPKAKRKAGKMVRQSDGDMKTVIDTPALKEFVKNQSHYFGKDSLLSLEEGYAVGDWISERFAENAKGNVHICIDGVKPHGTFNRAEVPALLDNPDLDKFYVYDSQPSVRGVQPFEPMEFNRQDFQTYLERKLIGRVDRRLDQSSLSQAVDSQANADTLTAS